MLLCVIVFVVKLNMNGLVFGCGYVNVIGLVLNIGLWLFFGVI